MINIKGKFCFLLTLVSLLTLGSLSALDNPPVGGEFSSSSLHFNMDACSAFNSLGTNYDYTEFTAEANNSGTCLQMEVVGGNLYRDEPLRNPHSCTAGASGNAMCVSSVMDCTYPAGHMRSVKIDVQVTPGSDGTGTLSSLSFFELAPQNYSWINGASGLNNYPTRYGVRVLKNGTEIFRSADNATSNTWSLESFDFTSNSEFTVTTTSVFTFEFIGYCLINNGSLVNAWDLDEITIESTCGLATSGGTISLNNGGTSTSACVGLGNSTPIAVDLVGNQGTGSQYIITDEEGNILGLPAGSPFDFDSAGTGVCLLWHAGFNGDLTNVAVGNNVSEVEGCYDLSNPITINRFTASGGTLTSTTGNTVCSSGSNLVQVSTTGAVGTSSLIVTDLDGIIIGLPTSSPVDISQYSGDACLIWNLGYNGAISGLTIGANASGITGSCFNLSNSIFVSKTVVNGGILSTGGATYVGVCDGDGASTTINPTLSSAQGDNTQIVLTDANGNIIDTNPSFPLDLAGYAPGRYLIYNLSWTDMINGLSNGTNIADLQGFCVATSNAITIDKESANGGTISSSMGSNFDICISGVNSDPIDASVTGNIGSFNRWIITDENDNIISLPSSPPFILPPGLGSTCIIRHLSFEPSFNGLFIGQNISEFTGCYGISNGITINKESASGGVINSGGFTFLDICGGAGNLNVNVQLFNNFGNNQNWVVSSPDGTILSLGAGPNFDFASYGTGQYNINHVAYQGNISGLTVGGNINSLASNCFGLSNTILVNKYDPVGGTITPANGGSEINVCGDGVNDMISVNISGDSGGFSRWIVTDAAGTIIGLPFNSPFNFEGYPNGTCQLWHISYENGIAGLTLGSNAGSLRGCYSLSNPIAVNKTNISPGTITTSTGSTTVSICLEDNEEDIVDVTGSGSNASNGVYVITDNSGVIIDANASFPYDFSGAGSGTCRIYFVGYDDVSGLSTGSDINNLGGCYALSNFITVFRNVTQGGQISLDGGAVETTICVGEGTDDFVNVTLSGSGNGNTNRWVITDEDGNIVGLPSSSPFNLEGAGAGTCYIWNLNYSGSLSGLNMGSNVSGLSGCFDLSNSIKVNRYTIDSSASTSTVTYTMNACNAQNGGNAGADFSEMTGIVANSSSCTTLSGSNIYRNNPVVNPHSCTPGLNGTVAMCVSSSQNCNYTANSDLAVRFDITISPAANGTGTLSTLSFYEAAPLNFNWIDGTSGPNNYPTRYGIRVMANGAEVFRQAGIATSFDYSLESFDFTNNPAFTVTEETVFSFELLGYCTSGINSTVSAWDIEDLVVTSLCAGGLNGGDLAISSGANAGGTSMQVCVDDGANENITLSLLNAAGPNMAYVITDTDGKILALPNSQPFNFEGTGAGTCLIWNLAFTDGLIGATVGAFASDLQGCFSLSNPITINRSEGDDCTETIVNGGTLNTVSGLVAQSLCINDGESDMINLTLEGQIGTNNAWIITDANNAIVALPNSFPFDFEGSGAGNAYIYNVSYEGALFNMELGNTINMIEGHYALSNAVIVNKSDCEVETVEALSAIARYPDGFSVYPNPAINQVTISPNQKSASLSTVVLYNSYGQIINEYRIGNDEITVNLGDYPEGFYHVKVISGDNSYTTSFTKM